MLSADTDLMIVGAGDPDMDGRYVWYDRWNGNPRWLQLDIVGEQIRDERNQLWFNEGEWRLGRSGVHFYSNSASNAAGPLTGTWVVKRGKAPAPQISAIDDSFNETQSVWLQRALAMGKAVAGGVKFFMEDLYGGGLQVLFLIKKWHDLTTYARVFTMVSVLSGVLCSLAGPITEFVAFMSIKMPENADESTQREGAMSLYDAQSAENGYSLLPLMSAHKEQKEGEKVRKLKRKPACLVNNISIGALVLGQSHRSRVIHRALVIAGLIYWGSIAALPFITSVECGKAFPPVAFYVFFFSTIICIVIEIWVIIHCRHGYLMFKNFRLKFVLGLLFGFLGRFDSFSDVMATMSVSHCHPISEVTLLGHNIPLPADLGTMMAFGLIVGVVLAQALPGLCALLLKKWLPIGFKLNELCMVLAVMDDEAKNGDEGDDAESNIFELASKF